MGQLHIDQSKVTAQVAQTLQNLCPFGGFEYNNGTLNFTAGCRTCKLCVRKGPSGVVTYTEEAPVVQVDKSLWRGIAVYIETNFHVIHPVSFELIGKARELADVIHHPVFAILVTDPSHADELAEQLLSYGTDKVFIYSEDRFGTFNVELHARAVEDFIEKIKPSAILYGGTMTGRSLAPRIAAHCRTGLTADCTSLEMKENTDLVQIRPAFGGNIMAQIICPNTRPQMATARYKIFKMPEKTTSHGEKIFMELSGMDWVSGLTRLLCKEKEKTQDISLSPVIVACGRAFKCKEDLQMAQELADLLGGMIATSRPLVEMGWKDVKQQIGLSGKTVAPKLIITLGISGAVQFAAGMSGSELVISINSDPNATIFSLSHYGIVGDIYQIVPELIKSLKSCTKK